MRTRLLGATIILLIAHALGCDAQSGGGDGGDDDDNGSGASGAAGTQGSGGGGAVGASGGAGPSGGGGEAGSAGCMDASCDDTCGGPNQACCSYRDACDAATLGCQGGTCQSCVVAIDTGWEHACVLKTDGSIWCWGYNAYEQLGFMGADEVPTPTKITSAPGGVTELNLGNYKTCVRGGDDNLACWGYYESLTSDLEETFAGNAAGAALGLNHTCVLTESDQAWCWGDNDYGQLGNGGTTWSDEPVLVSGLGSGVASVVSTGDSTCARKSDGSAWCWGANGYGQLALGNTDDQLTPVQVTALGNDVADIAVTTFSGCALKTDGSVSCWGGLPPASDVFLEPIAITGLSSGVSKIAVGRVHGCAIKEADASVWCWGYNDLHQLGVLEPYKTGKAVELEAVGKGFVQIASDYGFTCALKDDGSVWCWGSNSSGELGQGHLNEVLGPVQVPLACP